MRIEVVTPPDHEPLTMGEARAHLRLDGNDDDATVLALIMAARAQIEAMTGRSLITRTLRAHFDGFAAPLWLPRAPVSAVSSISYVDQAGEMQTLAADRYQVVAGEWSPAVYPAYGVSWPGTRPQPEAVSITYVAGYGTINAIPAPIKAAMLLLVGHLFQNREAASPDSISEMPMGVEYLLSNFRITATS